MEAQTQANKNEGTQGSAPQPQRDKKQNRPRNKDSKPTGYYKTDVPVEETKPAQQQGTNDSNQESQEKSQRQYPRQQGGNRGERSFQPKGPSVQNGESNGTAPQSPKENGRPKNRRAKPNNQRDDGGNKKNYQKKDASDKQENAIGNERFDNSEVIEKGTPVVRDPHRAHQIAEAARIQQLIPSGGMSPEVQEKIKKIQEVVPQKFEEVYAALEENGFDEEKTLSSLLEPNGKEEEHNNKAPRPLKWASVVKKGTRYESPVFDNPQRNARGPQRNGNPTKFNNPAPQNVHHPVDNHNPVMEAFVSAGMMDPEMVVQSLTMAIQSQLQMIQEQTKMLTMMQNELTVITQSGTSERHSLLTEQEELSQRKARLEEELDEVHFRMQEVEQALEDNKKKKAEKISTITQNNMVAALLKKQPVLPQLTAGPAGYQDQPVPTQHQGRPAPQRQGNYRRNYQQHGQAS